MKRCTKCGTVTSRFSPNKITKDGLQSCCKDCHNESNKTYRRTKHGLITRIYDNQRTRSKTRKHNPPTYTKKELREWCFSQKIFHELYDYWKEGRYEVMLAPSCDRIDDSKGYSLSNIQLITWGENKQKAHDDMRAGKITHGNKPQKPVTQCDLNGNRIAKFHSIHEAGRRTGVDYRNISSCGNGKLKTAGGFRWTY